MCVVQTAQRTDEVLANIIGLQHVVCASITSRSSPLRQPPCMTSRSVHSVFLSRDHFWFLSSCLFLFWTIDVFTRSQSASTRTQVFLVSVSLKKKSSQSLSLGRLLTPSTTDRLEKNAECSPLECWECGRWIPALFSSQDLLKDESKHGGVDSKINAFSFTVFTLTYLPQFCLFVCLNM